MPAARDQNDALAPFRGQASGSQADALLAAIYGLLLHGLQRLQPLG